MVTRPVRLPEGDALVATLARLGFSDRDTIAVVERAPERERQPEIWSVLERARDRLVASIDKPGQLDLVPPGAGELAAPEALLGVYVFLSALVDILAWHEDRGVTKAVSWATLSDLGRHVDTYHRFHGRVGFNEEGWLSLHFRGLLFQLGRLQFERAQIRSQLCLDRSLLDAAGPGQEILDIHIPEAGPLRPELCSESLAATGPFFDRHFPDEDYRVGLCTSWLLDEQLAEYLPESSNIVQFQRRFTLLRGAKVDDEAIVRFVFRKLGGPSADLPQRTTLERAVLAHVRSGRHWHVRTGWLVL